MTGVYVKSDNAKLRSLMARMRKLFPYRRRTNIAKEMGAIAVKGVEKTFKTSRTPYGAKWERLKHRRGKPLVLTGRLKKSIRLRITPTGYSVYTPIKYASTHNYGAAPIPMRQFMPTRGYIPDAWTRPMQRIAKRHMKRALT